MTAVPLSLASAVAFAVGTVLAHGAATTAGAATTGLRQLAGRMVRQPAFLAGQLCGAVGMGLHGAALAAGLVVVVQPLLCTGLVMALVLAALVDRRHPGRALPHRRQWTAAVVLIVGLALFLTTATPKAGAGHPSGWVLPASVVTYAGIAATAALAVVRRRIRSAAVVLGAVAGPGLALTGVLLKVVADLPADRWVATWPLYALVGVGGLGNAFAQWSYTAGPSSSRNR